jgi:hypothetical protein
MLKNILLPAVLCLLFHFTASGQPGKFLIGGNVGFSYSSDESETSYTGGGIKSKTISFSGAPVFGYFITKNFMAGLDFDFSIEKTTAEEGIFEFSKTRSITLNPFLRIYFNSPFFAEARFIWGPSKYTAKYDDAYILGDTEATSRKIGFGAGVGYDIKLTEGLRLEPMLYYTRYTFDARESEYKNKQDKILINLGLIYIL